MNKQEILHNAEQEYKEKVTAQVHAKKVIKRGRKAKPEPVMITEKPQTQIIKKVIPQDLEYLKGELNQIFNRGGGYEIDIEKGLVNFTGGKKIQECETLLQPAQTLIACAKAYVNLSFGNAQ